jgi:hypothetical protein
MSQPKTFQDVINILNTAVNRADIAAKSNNYMDFINQAVRDIAYVHSWDQLSATATVTLAQGQTTVLLPNNFKDLQPGRFPAYVTIPDLNITVQECPVFSKEEISRIQSSFLPNPSLIYTSDNQGFQLGLIPPAVANSAWTILLYYFAYPDVVTDPTQTTQLLVFVPQLVISRTLSLIFQSINDPVWEEHEKTYQAMLQMYVSSDTQISQPEHSN